MASSTQEGGLSERPPENGGIKVLMQKIKSAFGRVGLFTRRHKKAAVLLAALVVLAIGLSIWRSAARRPGGLPAGAGIGQSYVRTVTLQKTSLDDSISANGTVASADVSTVTTELKYTVKDVKVKVGDSVQEGDVICTLDTSDLESQISKLRESLAEQKESAQEKYDAAVKAKSEAKTAEDEAYTTYSRAKSALDTAAAAFNSAKGKVTSFQAAYDTAAADLEARLQAYNAALAANQSAAAAAAQAQAAYEGALAAYRADAGDSALKQALDSAATAYLRAYYTANGTAPSLDGAAAADTSTAGLTDTKSALDEAKQAYEKAQEALDTAQKDLDDAKAACGYTGCEQAYNSANSAYNTAAAAYDQAKKNTQSADDSVASTQKELSKAGTSDELENLQEQLEKCTLRASTSGKVTALDATVGSLPGATVATIQDTAKLKVEISIAEYDIEKVRVGLPVRITSDVTDQEFTGVLSQVSPTATGGGSASSSFSAEVTVDGASEALRIGTNAKVEIILSTAENVFTVPLDAVGQNESGQDVVYVKTGEENGEPVFEEMPVTTGASNDYYVEISGEGLEEGMQVRAAADPDEAAEDDPFGGMMMGGGAMAMGGGEITVTTPGGAAVMGG